MCGNDAATVRYQSIGVWLFTAWLYAVRASSSSEQMAYGADLAHAAGRWAGCVVVVGAPNQRPKQHGASAANRSGI